MTPMQRVRFLLNAEADRIDEFRAATGTSGGRCARH